MTAPAILLGLTAALCWALGQTILKLAVDRIDLAILGLIRWMSVLPLALGAGLLFLEIRFTSAPDVWGMAGLAGVVDAFLGTGLLLYALRRTPGHQAVSLANTAPLWGVLASVLFLGDPARIPVLVAAVLVSVGAFLLVSRGAGRRSKSSRGMGTIAAVFTGIMWGIAETVLAKYCLDRGMSPAGLLIVFAATASFCWSLLLVGTRFYRRLVFDWRSAGIGVGSAVVGAFLGWIAWLSGLELSHASLLAPVRGMTVLFGFLAGVILLRERPASRAAIGAVVVTAGVLLVATAG